MAANTTPIFVGVILGKQTVFAAGSATTEADIFAGDATESTRIDSITLTTDDTAVKLLNIYMLDNAGTPQDFLIANIPTAITAGNTALGAAPPCNVMAHVNMTGIVQVDGNGNRYINLPPGWKLRAKFAADLTSAKSAWVNVRGGKY